LSTNPLVNEFWTRATGKALPNQTALLDMGGATWWAVSVVTMAVSWTLVGVGARMIPTADMWNLILVPAEMLGLVTLVGRLRAQQVVFGHHAVHGTLSKHWPWLNAFVRYFATVVPLAQNQKTISPIMSLSTINGASSRRRAIRMPSFCCCSVSVQECRAQTCMCSFGEQSFRLASIGFS
jgi:hypothetical protein